MGLDQYLTRRSYVKNWDHMKDEERHKITVRKGGEIRSDIKPERISNIIEEVAVWRKANQIHKWFVDNVQDGNDDCGEYYVSREQLNELLETVNRVLDSVEIVDGLVSTGTSYKKDPDTGETIVTQHTREGRVIKNPQVAKELLPTTSGFFFGNTDYDEYYIQDLEYTKKVLEDVLSQDEEGLYIDYYYSSSW